MRQRALMDQEVQSFAARVTAALGEQPDTDLGLCELLTETNTYLHTEAASIFVLDPARGELVLTCAAGPDIPSILGLRMPLGRGVVGWVVQYCEDLIVPATDLDPRFYSGVDEHTGFATRSILCVPLVYAGQTLGAIEVLNKTTGHFNADDVVLVQEIARAVAKRLVQ